MFCFRHRGRERIGVQGEASEQLTTVSEKVEETRPVL
jgi:hypothetical protein